MPETVLAHSEPLESLHRIETSVAVTAEKLTRIEEHLRTLNGRVGRTEDRLSALDQLVAEARGAWKFIALLSAIPSGLIGAAAVWISQHSGGK